jgi:medium-chain acyl-[acyl-carrier-protein] hydrolase
MVPPDSSALKRLFPVESNKPAVVDLFCLPCAGGSSTTYRGWDEALPEWLRVVPVELPGRNGRFDEPFATSSRKLIASLAESIHAASTRPYAIFGHSMGALLAFHLAVELNERTAVRRPVAVIVSGRRAPADPGSSEMDATSGGSLIERIRRYDGVPPEVMDDPELAAVFLPIFRHDFALVEELAALAPRVIGCPLAAVSGDSEPDFEARALCEWQALTAKWMGCASFPGSHFYFRSAPSRTQLLSFVVATIQESLQLGEPASRLPA